MKIVEKFYNYWFDFQSWRDFSKYDEYNLDEAEDRFEKRCMERENKRLRKKHEKAERSRIIKLVEMAYENDPRIKKRR